MSEQFPAIEIGGEPPLGMSSFDAMGETFDGYDAGGSARLSRFGLRFFAPMMGDAFCPVVDPTPPAVTILSPAPGAAIIPTTPISLRVTDNAALRRVLLLAEYAGSRTYEVVHDGTQFAPLYRHGSVRQSIANGYQYELRRSGGWPGSPTLRVVAIDVAGNEA